MALQLGLPRFPTTPRKSRPKPQTPFPVPRVHRKGREAARMSSMTLEDAIRLMTLHPQFQGPEPPRAEGHEACSGKPRPAEDFSTRKQMKDNQGFHSLSTEREDPEKQPLPTTEPTFFGLETHI